MKCDKLTKEFCMHEIEHRGYFRIGPFLLDRVESIGGIPYACGRYYQTMDQAIDAFIDHVENWRVD